MTGVDVRKGKTAGEGGGKHLRDALGGDVSEVREDEVKKLG